MALLRLDAIFFFEYGDEKKTSATRLFRFYANSLKVKSIFIASSMQDMLNHGVGKALNQLDLDNNPAVQISRYELDEFNRIAFQIKTPQGYESFKGKMAMDMSYLQMEVMSSNGNSFSVDLQKFDLISYIMLKELGIPYSFE